MLMYALMFAAGYAAAIYTWPKFKLWANGEHAELLALRAKAGELEPKIREKF